MKKVLSVLLVLILMSGCASTTEIRSSDPEAEIYVNGEHLGAGTVIYTDKEISGTTNVVTIKKENCEEQVHSFSRNEDFDAGAFAAGVFTLVPLLWILKYQPVHSYDYVCQPK